jgi:uncharacterized protein (DUF924 family)
MTAPVVLVSQPEWLELAQKLVASGQDRSLPGAQRVFADMPYMHSKSALVHVGLSGCFFSKSGCGEG